MSTGRNDGDAAAFEDVQRSDGSDDRAPYAEPAVEVGRAVAMEDDHPKEVEGEDLDQPKVDEENAGSAQDYFYGIFHWNVIKYFLMLTLAGMANGLPTGMNGVWIVLQEYSEDCGDYKSPGACRNAMNQECTWRNDECQWTVGMCKDLTTESSKCHDHGLLRCHYDYGDSECKNNYGYTALYSGIFTASSMVAIIFFGLFCGDFLAFLHHRRAFMLCGFFIILFGVLQHVAVATNEYWVVTVGRTMTGFAALFTTVPAMVYVNQNAPDRYKQVLVASYCILSNLGQTVPAVIGGALGLSVDFHDSGNQLAWHFQVFCAFGTLCGVVTVLFGYFLTESPYWEGENKDAAKNGSEDIPREEDILDADEKELLKRVDELEKAKGIDVAEYSWASMSGRLIVGICVAGVVQLTGISAMSNYAPTITGRIGMQPLVGGILVNVWNVISASMSLIILAFTSNLRLVMLYGTMITVFACLIIGVLIIPGVLNNTNARNGISMAGIAIYIMAFQSCVACAFYPLTQEMFPLSFRPRGSSFMNTFLMLFAFLICVFFPIAVQGLSGGAGGDQNQGMGIVFLFFAVVGLICFVILFLFLKPWTAQDERRYRERRAKNGIEA